MLKPSMTENRVPGLESPGAKMALFAHTIRVPWVPAVLLLGLALTAVAYQPVICSPVFDGDDVLHMNRSRRLVEDLTLGNWKREFQFENPTEPELIYRPMIIVIYLLEYLVSPGATWGMRSVSLVIHILNGALLFLLMIHLGLQRYPALAAAILYVIHPVQPSTVAYIGNGHYMLAVFKFIAGLILLRTYMIKKTRRALLAGLVLYGVGLAEVEIILTFPFVLFVMNEICFPLERSTKARRYFVYLTLMAIMVGYYGLVIFRIQALAFQQGLSYMRVRMWERVLDLHLSPLTFYRLLWGAFSAPGKMDKLPSGIVNVLPWITAGYCLIFWWAGRPLTAVRRRIFLFGSLFSILTYAITYPEVELPSTETSISKFFYLPLCGIALMIGSLLPEKSYRLNRLGKKPGIAALIILGFLVILYLPLTRMQCQALDLHSRLVQNMSESIGGIQKQYKPGARLVIFSYPLKRVILHYPREMAETAFLLNNIRREIPAEWFYIVEAECVPGAYNPNAQQEAPFFPDTVIVSWNQSGSSAIDCTDCFTRVFSSSREEGYQLACFQNVCQGPVRYPNTLPPRIDSFHLNGWIKKITVSSMKHW